MNDVDSAVDLEVLGKFSLRILIIFAVIFVLAYLTPKIANVVDSWIRKYRQNHGKAETYGIRSIYELPPAPDEDSAEDPCYDPEAEEDPDDEADLPDEEPAAVLPPADTEPVYLFSFAKLEEEPYTLDRKTVRFGRKFAWDFPGMDLSAIAFGKKGHPATYELAAEPDDAEDEEFDASLPPIRYAPFVEHFFEEDESAEPAQDTEDDLPWFMR